MTLTTYNNNNNNIKTILKRSEEQHPDESRNLTIQMIRQREEILTHPDINESKYHISVSCQQFAYPDNIKLIADGNCGWVFSSCGLIYAANEFENIVRQYSHHPCAAHSSKIYFLIERFKNGSYYIKNFLNNGFIEVLLNYNNTINRKYLDFNHYTHSLSSFFPATTYRIRFGGFITDLNNNFCTQFKESNYIEYDLLFELLPYTNSFLNSESSRLFSKNNHEIYNIKIPYNNSANLIFNNIQSYYIHL